MINILVDPVAVSTICKFHYLTTELGFVRDAEVIVTKYNMQQLQISHFYVGFQIYCFTETSLHVVDDCSSYDHTE